MRSASFRRTLAGIAWLLVMAVPLAIGMSEGPSVLPKAFLDGTGPGWRALGEDDFAKVNCDPETWTWKDGVVHCTGRPVGVIRTEQAGDQLRAGRRVAAPPVGRQFGDLRLGSGEGPRGHQARPRCRAAGSRSRSSTTATPSSMRSSSGKKADWFTTNGDVFPVGTSKMTPFPPLSPDGSRSFPQEGAEQGRRRVEPLLRPGHQRRDPALGQRRGGLRRQRLRAGARDTSASNPRARRSSSASCASASCRDARDPIADFRFHNEFACVNLEAGNLNRNPESGIRGRQPNPHQESRGLHVDHPE